MTRERFEEFVDKGRGDKSYRSCRDTLLNEETEPTLDGPKTRHLIDVWKRGQLLKHDGTAPLESRGG